ncbi:chorismate mutase [Fimbriimonas ginsengisoli Gsoil 348]|uniref:Chorismate mutase n=1 Tax=Fimbriimonas ginsengisoli Gsoil 348 TaxID=661478 RepID=A0A068NWL4_FIMGI|nr:chorismate mutase [Fimbriimonas ginsengisoli Gsoil 348]
MAASAGAESDRQAAERFVGLLRQRLLLSREVAIAKFNSGAPVEDLKREKALIDQTLKSTGAEHEFAYRILRAQIEASKAAQRRFISKWAGHPRFRHAPNLAKDVRPKLDLLTTHMLSMLPKLHETRPAVLRRAATQVRWPKQDRDCFGPAWKVAVAPVVEN